MNGAEQMAQQAIISTGDVLVLAIRAREEIGAYRLRAARGELLRAARGELKADDHEPARFVGRHVSDQNEALLVLLEGYAALLRTERAQHVERTAYRRNE